MKLTKKLEAEVLKFYHDYWDAYLAGDIKSFSAALDDAVTIVGTAISEIFHNKKQTVRFYKDTVDQMTNSVRLRNRKISLQPVGSTVIIHEQMDFYVLLDEKWAFYGHARLSAVLIQTKKSWKLIHQHASFPDSRAEEGEQMASKQIAAENLKLREAVERHTVELRETNRELEIETALEKVRAIAMGMKEAADMLEICKIISQELNRLGIKEIRNVQTAIIYKEKEKYLNYEFYAKHNKLLTTEADYSNHPMSKAFAKKMLGGPNSFFRKSLKGKKVQEWYAFQKTTNQFIDKYLAKATSLSYYWYSLGPVALGISTYQPLNKEEENLVIRFRNVFELSYRRYLDIEKAEAQAKEAKIETSLERIRAAAMSMMKPEELLNISEVMVKEFHVLGFQTIRNAQIDIFNDNKKTYLNYECESEHFRKTITEVQYDSHPIVQAYLKQIRKAGDAFFSFAIKGKDFDNWKAWLKTLGYTENARLEQTSSLNYYNYSIGVGSLGISTYGPLDEDRISILKRFRNVFGLAYRRYADIAQAEAQAREGQIQLALERVRARTMAMQKSDELKDVAHELRVQLAALGTSELETCAINLYEEYDESLEAWAAVRPPDSPKDIVEFHFLLPKKGIFIIEDMIEAYASGAEEFLFELSGDKGTQWMNKMAELVPGMFAAAAATPDFKKTGSVQAWFSCYYFSGGSLIMITMTPPLEESRLLMKRCAQVFGLAYRRFADLKKSEEQGKEAQVQLALERVRARTMAMQHSNELPDAANILLQQVQSLGMQAWSAGYCIWNDDKSAITLWMSSAGIVQKPFHAPVTEDPSFIHFYEAYKRGETFYVEEIGGNEIVEHYKYMCRLPVVGEMLNKFVAEGGSLPTFQIYHLAFFSQGFLLFITYEPVPEAHDIFKRFGKVFEQTYTRFLDLQKAEAQTREATIEASLERVRAKAMAMHKSDDLTMAVTTVFEELDKLNLGMLRCGIGILYKETRCANVWTTAKSGEGIIVQVSGNESMDIHPLLHGAFETWLRGEDFSYELKGDDVSKYYHSMHATNYSLPGNVQPDATVNNELSQYYFKAHFQGGGLFAFRETPFPNEAISVMKRFAAVFNLTYKRFLDLQKAEAQAREAQIEAALERVRSVAMGMMKSEDLMTICKSVFTQLQVLGFDALRAAQIYIRNDDEKKFINYDYSDDTGVDTVEVNYNSHPYTKRIYDVIRNAGDGLIHNTIAKKELDEWKSYLYNTLGQPPEKSLETADELHYYLYSFGIGAFGICTFKTINKEELEILKRFRNVFNLSYHRYSDIALAEAHALQAKEDLIKLQTEKKRAEEALTELRATQTQLIQSEKMASLGQLTAGIAHEIQNPLNFVNNFSEVSEELMKEMMEEVDKGNMTEVKNIAADLIQNLEKIYHHGKRADSIVKGMLEHSRTNAGNVQPTDINALADEYLRLSYHGLRAKDKSFNTTIHTDFDNSIGTINIVGQDIARVLLNLYNNAFYAVNEKKKSLGNSYQPSVTVITKHFPSLLSGKERNGIIITVADNGNGIPQNIVDKIFQPFFTTKPTGQGTGLGLSLAYDIIKAHGGEIKTETKEDEGTEFIIQLPAT